MYFTGILWFLVGRFLLWDREDFMSLLYTAYAYLSMKRPLRTGVVTCQFIDKPGSVWTGHLSRPIIAGRLKRFL